MTEAEMRKLVLDFNQEMDDFADFFKRNYKTYKYYPSDFMHMKERYGAVEAARMLVRRGNTIGLQNLAEFGLLWMSVEAYILYDPKYRPLFSDEDRMYAKEMMLAYSFMEEDYIKGRNQYAKIRTV